MTAKKTKAARSLEEILKLSARQRAAIVINYREDLNYSFTPEISAEVFNEVEDSLLRTDRENAIYKRARLVQSESRELVLQAWYNSTQALLNLENVRAQIEGQNHYRELSRLKELLTKPGAKAPEALEYVSGLVKDREYMLKNWGPFAEFYDNELKGDLQTYRALTKASREMQKYYRLQIRRQLEHLKVIEQWTESQIKNANNEGITTAKAGEEAPEDVFRSILDSRVRFIDGST